MAQACLFEKAGEEYPGVPSAGASRMVDAPAVAVFEVKRAAASVVVADASEAAEVVLADAVVLAN